MNRKLTFVLSFLLPSALVVHAAADPSAAPARPRAANPAGKPAATSPASTETSLLVSPAWLAAHLGDRDLVLLHVGDPDTYRTQHIAGARGVTLKDISVSASGDDGLHLEMPPAEDLRHRLEALGISNSSHVVVYFSEDWVSPATRVVLTLDAAGLGDRTVLLDGGMSAWVRDGHPVTDAVPPARTGKLAPLAMRPIIVTATTVMSSLGKPGFAVVDARDQVFYDGTKTGGHDTHPHRAGHIAGALGLPYTSVFDDNNRLRSPDDLAALFARAGVKPGDTVIGYCHVGMQATAMLFAARRLGHPVLLYDGSFEDWSQNHPGYAVEKGAARPAGGTP